MKLTQLLETVVSSQRTDWHHIACWGAHSGPSYREHFTFYEGYEGDEHVLKADSHGNTAIYIPDASITMAFGLEAVEDFKEQWANSFPDPSASSSFVDLFYQGALVYRDVYVNVDGGRAKLPLPRRIFDKQTKKVTALHIPEAKYQFFKLLDEIEHLSDFDRYFEQAGFQIVQEPWPDLSR